MGAATRDRHEIRRSALKLFDERGFDTVTLDDVAAAVSRSVASVEREFSTTRDIVVHNDYFDTIVDCFENCPPELSCAGAWVVAIDEIANSMSAEEWETELRRTRIFFRDERHIGGVSEMIASFLFGLKHAVAERANLPVESAEVVIFSGAIYGMMLSIPITEDRCEWVKAHAIAIESLGPALDHMLRVARNH